MPFHRVQSLVLSQTKLHIVEQKKQAVPSQNMALQQFQKVTAATLCHTYTLVYSYEQLGTFTQFTQSAFKQIRSGCPLSTTAYGIVQHSKNGSVTGMTRNSEISHAIVHVIVAVAAPLQCPELTAN